MSLVDELLPKTSEDGLGVPANDPTAGPRATGRNGYEWDAFSGQAQLNDTHPSWIPFHNHRQQAISEIAWCEGMTAQSLKEIPKCPPKWTDVEHYWTIVSVAGWIFYEYGLNSKGSFAIRIAQAGGIAGIFEIAKKILPTFGITI